MENRVRLDDTAKRLMVDSLDLMLPSDIRREDIVAMVDSLVGNLLNREAVDR